MKYLLFLIKSIFIYLATESDESESNQGSQYSSMDEADDQSADNEIDGQSTDDKSNQKSELFLLLIDAYMYIHYSYSQPLKYLLFLIKSIFIYLATESDESESNQGSQHSSMDEADDQSADNEIDGQSTDDKSNQKSELFLLLIDAYIYMYIHYSYSQPLKYSLFLIKSIFIYLAMESDESESNQGSQHSSMDEADDQSADNKMDGQSTDDKSNQKSEPFLLLIDAYMYIYITVTVNL